MADPKVCVSLDGTTIEEMVEEAARANLAGADMVEVRFDRLFLKRPDLSIADEEEGEAVKMPPENQWETKDFSEIDIDSSISNLKEGVPLPVVFTVRPVSEGGFFPGVESERIEILTKAIESEVSWLDLEMTMDPKQRGELLEMAREKGCKIIASKHDINGIPNSDEIVSFVKESQESGDIVKFCGTARSHADALQIVEAATELKGEGLAHSLMSLNSGGDWARIHAPVLDQSLVYATLQNDFQLPERGLVNVRDLRDAWTLLEY